MGAHRTAANDMPAAHRARAAPDHRALGAATFAATLALLTGARSAAADAPTQLEARAVPAELTIGQATSVRGHLAGAGTAGLQLSLESSPYPYRAFRPVARAIVQGDGRFAFPALQPDRNTHLRVSVEGTGGIAPVRLSVTVDPRVKLSSRVLGRGRTSLAIRVRHAPLAGRAPISAWWFLRAHGSRVFALATVSRARELAGDVLFASAVVDPPSRNFAFRVCVNPPWEAAMGPPATHGPCPHQDFVLRHGR